jgi:hypothetical protein
VFVREGEVEIEKDMQKKRDRNMERQGDRETKRQ